jgi:hypothetical protein
MAGFESSFDDPLEIWAAAPQLVSFGIEAGPVPPEDTLYRVNLPAQEAAAHDQFDQNDALFVRVSAALEAVPARLDSLAQAQSARAAGTSFALGDAFVGAAEGELLDLLGDADRQALRATGAALNFGVGEQVSQAWQAARDRFDGLVTQIDHDALHLAWVETNIDERLIARTIVDWNGTARSAWLAEAGPAQTALHQRSLASMTQTRLLRLRLFVTIASGAARLAGLMATPAGAVLALPAVYQYITRILAQARQLESIQTT